MKKPDQRQLLNDSRPCPASNGNTECDICVFRHLYSFMCALDSGYSVTCLLGESGGGGEAVLLLPFPQS